MKESGISTGALVWIIASIIIATVVAIVVGVMVLRGGEEDYDLLTTLALESVENDAANNEMKVNLANCGPGTITAGSIRIEFEGMYGATFCEGSADNLPDADAGQYVNISWETANPPTNLQVGQRPASVSALGTLTIVFKGADAPDFRPTSLMVKKASSGAVIFWDTHLPDPVAV